MITTPDHGIVLDKYAGDRRDQQNLRFYSPLDDECILMQFTSVKDKNLREIYEGDIVRWDHGADDEDSGVAAVEFHAGAFCLGDPTPYPLRAFCHQTSDGVAKELEVIGDIYQTPELLQSSARKRRISSQHEDSEPWSRAS